MMADDQEVTARSHPVGQAGNDGVEFVVRELHVGHEDQIERFPTTGIPMTGLVPSTGVTGE